MEYLSDYLLGNEGLSITEAVYRGIRCEYVHQQGWKVCLGYEGYLLPSYQKCRAAIDDFHDALVNKHGATNLMDMA